MKITHVKSRVVFPEESLWRDFESYGQGPISFGIATCSHCKKRGVVRTTITN